MAKQARIRRTWKKPTARMRKHIANRPKKPVKMYKPQALCVHGFPL